MTDLFSIGELGLRRFELSDVQPQLDYLFRAPEGFLESIAIDRDALAKLTEKGYREFLTGLANTPSERQRFITMTKASKAIGNILITELVEGDSAYLHWHIWYPELRGRGIATTLAMPAARILFERFKLKTLLGKISKINPHSIKAVEKIGAKFLREEPLTSQISAKGHIGRCYRIL